MGLPDFQFDQEMRDYVVTYPYISNQAGDLPDGNPLLYLGLFLATKRQFSPLNDNDKMLVQANYKDTMIVPGLVARSRFKLADPESYDDYIGLSYAAYFLLPAIAKEIAAYGKAHDWNFNNTSERGLSALRFNFWIYAGVVAHVKLAAGDNLSFLDKLSWCLSLLHIGKISESGLQKEFLQVDLYRSQPRRYWLCNLAAIHWQRSLRENRNYPNAMGSVFGVYFGVSHILSRWMQGRIFS